MVDNKRKISTAHSRSEPLHSKRQRVSRACDQCRLAREKCDGIQPVCFTCASSNRACSYTTSPKKRGIQPGYIRTLELALAWSFGSVPGVEDSLKQALQDGKSQGILSGKDVDGSAKLHRKWRRSWICKGIDRLLSGSSLSDDPFEEPDSITDDDEDDTHIPSSAAVETNLLTPVSQPTSNSNLRPDIYSQARDIRTAPDTIQNGLPFSIAPGGTTKLKLPDNIWRLFDIYFNYTHSWLPIVEKHDILKMTYSYPHEGLDISLTISGSGQHALLWSILALASVQEAFVADMSQTSISAASTYSPSELLSISENLTCRKHGHIELGHAQALLLQSLIQTASSKFDQAWILLGQAIRMALLLDATFLSGSFQSQRPSDQMDMRIKHVLLGCFILETLLSAYVGKSPMLDHSHLGRLVPLPENSIEEWHPWEGCLGFGSQSPASSLVRIPSHSLSIFNQLSKLIGLLSEYLSRHGVNVGASDNSILPQLDQWLVLLPPDCMLNLDSNPQFTPQKLSLHLVFQCIAASFGQPHEQHFAATEIVGLFKRFALLFGDAALPPFITVLLSMVVRFGRGDQLPSDAHRSIDGKMSILNDIWTTHGEKREVESSTTPTPHPPSTSKSDHPLSMHAGSGPDVSVSQASEESRWIGIPFTSPSSTGLTHQFSGQNLIDSSNIAGRNTSDLPSNDSTIQSALPTDIDYVDTNQLHRYNSAGSLDLDALFDDLDGPERANTHPQFMQNLGFAPGADLTDILASDYGQFDPLLTSYMSGNALGLQSSDPSRIFDPG